MRVLLLVLIPLLFACSEEEGDCNASIDETPWLVELKNSITNCTCETSIFTGIYEDQQVFFILINDPRCNWVFSTTLYNCQGTEVRSFTSDDLEEWDTGVVSSKEIIYSCKEDTF